MLRAMRKQTHPVDRHYLLLDIVEETYRQRHATDDMRDTCERIAWQHLAEFPKLADALRAEFKVCGGRGELPLVPTFQHLATVLTEKGDYDKAIAVCKKALSFGLSNGTRGGFEGRIDRIRQKRERDNKQTRSAHKPKA